MPNNLSNEILYGTYDGVVSLIRNGYDVNEKDEYGFTPLIQATIKEHIGIIQLLLNNGSNVNDEDITGCTALYWACDLNNIKIAELLLNHGADPNHYSVDSQPILVNARLREQVALIDLLVKNGANITFAKDYINAKLIGHRFELSGKTDIINARGNFIELDLEGFFLEFTVGLIRQSLINFLGTNIAQNFPQFLPNLKKIALALHTAALLIPPRYVAKTAAHQAMMSPLLYEKLLIIPIGYEGHAITFVRFNKYFAKCDRGVSNITDTVIIYEMQNPYLLTHAFLESLVYGAHTREYIDKELKDLLKLKPVATLPTKSQISGNCSWANVEASVPAALFMLLLSTMEFDAATIATVKKSVMRFYNTWVEWDKDTALDECIAYFHESQNPRSASIATLLGTIMFQRCRANIKREVKRAQKILAIITKEPYTFILQSYIKVYLNEETKELGENFKDLLIAAGLNIETLTLETTILKSINQSRQINLNNIIKLHKAAIKGNFKTLQNLLDRKIVAVDALDNSGSTALIYAAWQGNINVVQLLIDQYHANPHIINDKGGTALKYARLKQHQTIVEFLEKL